jgi:hypothetical protein
MKSWYFRRRLQSGSSARSPRVAHVGQVQAGHQVGAVPVVLRREPRQLAAQEVEGQVGVAVVAQVEAARERAFAQEHHHRHHPRGVQQFGQVQAVVGQPVDGEARGLGFLLDHEQHRFAAPVRPFDRERHVEAVVAPAELFLELLFAQRGDLGPGQVADSGEEFQRGGGVVEDEVLEVLVVVHGGRGRRGADGRILSFPQPPWERIATGRRRIVSRSRVDRDTDRVFLSGR